MEIVHPNWARNVATYIGLDWSLMPDNFETKMLAIFLKYKEQLLAGEYDIILDCYTEHPEREIYLIGDDGFDPIEEVIEDFGCVAVFKDKTPGPNTSGGMTREDWEEIIYEALEYAKNLPWVQGEKELW